MVFAGDGATGGSVLVTEFRCMALNGLFYADVLRPLDLVPLTDFTSLTLPTNTTLKESDCYCQVLCDILVLRR